MALKCHINPWILSLVLCLCIMMLFLPATRANNFDHRGIAHASWFQTDTIPSKKETKREGILRRYYELMMKKETRDSLMRKLSKEDKPLPVADSIAFLKQQQSFARYKGRVIRDIYFNKVKVFGPGNIDDTTFTTRSKLIKFANGLHTDTREWVIRQALFFHENDTINPYKMADNERYIRNLSFITDARIYIINALKSPDSVDLLVVTKDQFEYGGRLSKLTTNTLAASVYNDNLLGAGQNVLVGFTWNKDYDPKWFSEMRYKKYNFKGTFTDIDVGYSSLNNKAPIDTGVYERSAYVNIIRPLYTSWARFTGGFSAALNSSMNVNSLPDTLYRDYAYSIFDVWAGYNFRNQFRKDGRVSSRPNMAVTSRYYKQDFSKVPTIAKYASDPVYNDHRYVLGSFVIFRQSFFRSNYFFGFGRTEDIPSGYNASITLGSEKWISRHRLYTGLDLQKYWLQKNGGLWSTEFNIGSFWKDKGAEDDVIDVNVDYYSRLLKWRDRKFRQFFHSEYIVCPNPVFLRPININRENGIFGYRNSMLSGYQRMNIQSETFYYSALKFIGFKFNFFAQLQASLLTDKNENLFSSPLYTGFGLGCNIRNENLSLNTLQFSASYMPGAPSDVKPFFFSITTIIDFRFNIYALNAPQLIQFR